MEKNKFDYWDFIEKNLPDYYSNEDVCLSNDISKMMDEPEDASEQCRKNVQQYVEDLTDKRALIDLLIEVDARLFKEALTHYYKDNKL